MVVSSSSSAVVAVAAVVVTNSSAFLQGTGDAVVLMLNLFINPIPILGGRVDTSEQSGRSELSSDDGNVVICSVVDDVGCKVVINSSLSLKNPDPESSSTSIALLTSSSSSSSPPLLSEPLACVFTRPTPVSMLLLLLLPMLLSMLLSGSHPSRLETAAATLLS